jgi:hypothetical protein
MTNTEAINVVAGREALGRLDDGNYTDDERQDLQILAAQYEAHCQQHYAAFMLENAQTTRYCQPVEAADVTQEILDLALDVANGWHRVGRIDWEDLLDRFDGTVLADGQILDLGDSMVTPAINKIKNYVRRNRG